MRDPRLKIPKRILKELAGQLGNYYLAGGTALSLVYLQHRESFDLDFFTQNFSSESAHEILEKLQKQLNVKVELMGEQKRDEFVKIATYMVTFGKNSSCKIDFVEDVVPMINSLNMFNGIPVLSVEDIYLRKIFTLSGHTKSEDVTGRTVMKGGRQEAKDFYDIYCLSKISTPLSEFIFELKDELFPMDSKTVTIEGLARWYSTFDRMRMKIGLHDLPTARKVDFYEADKHFQNEISLASRKVGGGWYQ